MKAKKYIFPLLAAVILIVADQFTKWLAQTFLMEHGPVPLWKGVFELQYLENRGAAFGLFQNQFIAFFILTLIITVFLVWFYIKLPEERKYTLLRVIVVVCFSGAIGNFIDRFFRGYVIDFFYFKLIDFPIFNVADIYITCSTILFFILFCFKYKEEDFKFLSLKKKEKDIAAQGKEGADDRKTSC